MQSPPQAPGRHSPGERSASSALPQLPAARIHQLSACILTSLRVDFWACVWADRQPRHSTLSYFKVRSLISHLKTKPCWAFTGFLQLFSGRQTYFHSPRAAVEVSSARGQRKADRTYLPVAWGSEKPALPAGLRTYLSSSVKCCCLLNHAMNFWSGVMQ